MLFNVVIVVVNYTCGIIKLNYFRRLICLLNMIYEHDTKNCDCQTLTFITILFNLLISYSLEYVGLFDLMPIIRTC